MGCGVGTKGGYRMRVARRDITCAAEADAEIDKLLREVNELLAERDNLRTALEDVSSDLKDALEHIKELKTNGSN